MLRGATFRPHWNAASSVSVAKSAPTAAITKPPRSAVTEASAIAGSTTASRSAAPSTIAPAASRHDRPLTIIARASKRIGTSTSAATAVPIFATTRWIRARAA